MYRFWARHGGEQPPRREPQQWQGSRRGRRVLALEETQLKRVLPEMFGRYIVQIGAWGRGARLLAAAEMLHRLVLGPGVVAGVQVVVDAQMLPLPSKSVDAVILPHTLEFVRSPHALLREADRVLNDRGQLVILGFNPWSLPGLRKRIGLHYLQLPVGGHLYSVGRICDWLALLGLETTEIIRFGVGFPWTPARGLGDPFGWDSIVSPLATNYLLIAKKRVVPIDRISLTQRAQVRPLIGRATAPLAGARSQRS